MLIYLLTPIGPIMSGSVKICVKKPIVKVIDICIDMSAVPAIKKYPANSRIIDDLEINFS